MRQALRIATFNLENFDDIPGQLPTLAQRIAIMRPQLLRINADILCLQEVNGQETDGQPRQLLALNKLIEGTPYDQYFSASTKTKDNFQVYDERNLVILSKFEIKTYGQFKNTFIPAPLYRTVTAQPPEQEADEVAWERPILSAEIKLPGGRLLYLLNLHLKSKIPTNIKGQKRDNYSWKTASGWAEGYFVSSMKRVGQALETRVIIDEIFDRDPDAYIVVCGDFNADQNEVPVMAIRGLVEHTGNATLANRVMYPCENGIPESARYSLFHRGRGEMIDHLLISRNMLEFYKSTEIHNEMLHDESIAFASDILYPESDHAPIIAEFFL
ncbi:MAG: endonuclease [Cyclobacteriaceae bacterium]|nr:endonuclease [Cyclobacteriaceae bacterium]